MARSSAGATPAYGTRRREVRTFRGTFSPGAPDWHYLPFTVPRGVNRIHVAYDYESRNTGAGFSLNVIDIGLFDHDGRGLGNAAGFRGWSGGARKEFFVSADRATPGYLPGPLTPGRWSVALGPVAIVSPGVAWKVTVTLNFGPTPRRYRPAPAPRRVPGTGPGWYRGDLHVHTVHSDGNQRPDQVAATARRAGLDFIVSTDHNTTSAHGEWGRLKLGNLLVINGEEVTTRNGHWLAVGLPAGAWIDWRYRAEDERLARFTRRVRDLGGLSIVAHPWIPVPTTKWDFGYDYADIDAIEAWNGPWTLDDQQCVLHWEALLRRGTFRPIVATSDYHRADQQIGHAQTVVHASSLATGAIVEAVKAGRSWLAESSAVDLEFVASYAGRSVSCGERLQAPPTGLVDVTLQVAGAPNCVATILGPTGPIATSVVDAPGSRTLTATVPVQAAPYVRAEVRRQLDDSRRPPETAVLPMVAITNPIFIG